MKKTLLTLVLTMAAIAGAMAQSITNATFSYSFNGDARRMSLPASGLDVVDLSGTVAENLKKVLKIDELKKTLEEVNQRIENM